MATESGSEEARRALRDRIEGRLAGTDGAAWLGARLAVAGDLAAVRQAMPEVARVVGRKHLVGGFAERSQATLPGVYGALRIGHWKIDEAVRTLLLAEAAARTERPFTALYETYDLGDTETRVAALRAVNLVADDHIEDGMALITDAGRTYLEPLLLAAWSDNPFSARHLSEQEYRKAVLKALFSGVPVDGFIGLEERADEELAKSLCEFADEREAAGRPVPHPVWTVAARHPRPGLVARLVGKIEHPLPDERLVAAKALANARDVRALPFIEERLARETDDAVRAALQAAGDRTRNAT